MSLCIHLYGKRERDRWVKQIETSRFLASPYIGRRRFTGCLACEERGRSLGEKNFFFSPRPLEEKIEEKKQATATEREHEREEENNNQEERSLPMFVCLSSSSSSNVCLFIFFFFFLIIVICLCVCLSVPSFRIRRVSHEIFELLLREIYSFENFFIVKRRG